jgi:cytochrome oxidase assembly protein ShyY1
MARRVPRADRDALSSILPYPIAPYQLILLEADAMADGIGYGGGGAAPMGAGVPIDRTRPVRVPLPSLDEGPHQSYAIQWFAFAAIALIGTAAVARGEWNRNRGGPAL